MTELYFAIAIAFLFLGLVFVQSYTSHRKWARREERKRREYRRKQERAMLESGIEQSPGLNRLAS